MSKLGCSVTPRFRFRKDFVYTGRRIDVPLPCTERLPCLGDVVRWAMDADLAPDGEWVLARDEDAVVVRLDADMDFKLRNPSGKVTRHFRFRRDFVYTNRRVAVPEPCTERLPCLGDVVCWAADAEPRKDGEWTMGRDEFAVVVKVDADGDFKLRCLVHNRDFRGVATPNFHFRRDFAFTGRKVFVPIPCTDRDPCLGDVVRWAGDAEPTPDGDWTLGQEEDAVVVSLDSELDFKLRNRKGMVTPHFRFRKEFGYVGRRVPTPVPCMERSPIIGDFVCWAEEAVPASDGDWVLKWGERAVVEDVDEDGDFKLRNPSGIITPRFRYRKDFVYPALKVGDCVQVSGLASQSGTKLNGRVGTVRAYLSDKQRFNVALAGEDSDEIVSIKPVNLRLQKKLQNGYDRSCSRSSSSSSSSERRPSKRSKR